MMIQLAQMIQLLLMHQLNQITLTPPSCAVKTQIVPKLQLTVNLKYVFNIKLKTLIHQPPTIKNVVTKIGVILIKLSIWKILEDQKSSMMFQFFVKKNSLFRNLKIVVERSIINADMILNAMDLSIWLIRIMKK